MPIYEYFNSETKQVEEHMVKIAEAEEFLRNNPHLTRKVGAPRLVDPMRLGTFNNRLPDDFKEGILGKAKEAHPLGTIDNS